VHPRVGKRRNFWIGAVSGLLRQNILEKRMFMHLQWPAWRSVKRLIPLNCKDIILLPQVYTGQLPFSDIRYDFEVVKLVETGGRPQRPDHNSRVAMPDDIWKIVQSCWKHQFSDRPSFEEVVANLKHERPSGFF
jgi:hypothetical protein